MERQHITTALKRQPPGQGMTLLELEDLLREHPYFAAGRALAAKMARDTFSAHESNLLVKAAVYAPSRQHLKAFIEGPALFTPGLAAQAPAPADVVFGEDFTEVAPAQAAIAREEVEEPSDEAVEASVEAAFTPLPETMSEAEEVVTIAEAEPTAVVAEVDTAPVAQAPVDFIEKVHVEVREEAREETLPAPAAAARPTAQQLAAEQAAIQDQVDHFIEDMQHTSDVIHQEEADELDEIAKLIAEMRRHQAQAMDVLEHPDHAASVAAEISAEAAGLPKPKNVIADEEKDFFAGSREAGQPQVAPAETVVAPAAPAPSAPAGRKSTVRKKAQSSIIEGFLEANPSIAVTNMDAGQDVLEDLAAIPDTPPKVVTEAMAKLLVKQGKLGKAIATYRELQSVKPDKAALFQQQIDELTSRLTPGV